MGSILVTTNEAPGEAGWSSLARCCDLSGTLRRHARLTSPLPIRLLAPAVILLAYRRGLVSAARCRHLLLSHSLPATVTAIAPSAITTRTDSEKRVAPWVKSTAAREGLR